MDVCSLENRVGSGMYHCLERVFQEDSAQGPTTSFPSRDEIGVEFASKILHTSYVRLIDIAPWKTANSNLSQYKKVPPHVKTDTIIPPASEIIPTIISSIRGPRHGRTVSVGPQSAADAYEAIAFREKVRRNSITNAGPLPSPLRYRVDDSANGHLDKQIPLRSRRSPLNALPTPPMTATSSVDNLAIDESALLSPPTPSASPSPSEGSSAVRSPSEDRRQDVRDDIQMFEKLQKPRVRYDVEVITKLIVYGGQLLQAKSCHVELIDIGIAWIAVEGGPILFYLTGLGLEGKGKT